MFDWQRLRPEMRDGAAVDPRRRASWIGVVFVAVAAIIFLRVISLERTDGPEFRERAARPVEQTESVPAPRGRILARDGSVLAEDVPVVSLAVHYRWLEVPSNPRWLRAQARSRLDRAERRKLDRLRAEESQVQVDRGELHRNLAELCGMSLDEWHRRRQRVQDRIASIAGRVDAARLEKARLEQARSATAEDDTASNTADSAHDGTDTGLLDRASRFLRDALRADEVPRDPPPVTLAEELHYHVLCEDISPTVVEEIELHPDRYPGVRIEYRLRRHYPHATLAANLIGHLGPVTAEELKRHSSDAGSDAGRQSQAHPLGSRAGNAGANSEASDSPYLPDDRTGRMAIERAEESRLRGTRGQTVERLDHRGRRLEVARRVEPVPGRDVRLTIDLKLQRTAEQLLDAALERPIPPSQISASHVSSEVATSAAEILLPRGGAAVVIDLSTGELLACATAPRFDPSLFGEGNPDRIQALLDDPRSPLIDRASRMAIPPGSLFKVVTSVAALQDGGLDPWRTVECRGYLTRPDRQRCHIFTHRGVGHGPITLADALAQSCNVYFYKLADTLGPEPILHWADRLGMGQKTNIELPSEADGNLPTSRAMLAAGGNRAAFEIQSLAIGQSTLTMTPLQAAKLMAAVATGRSITPRILADWRDNERENVSNRDARGRTEQIPAADRTFDSAVGEPIKDLSPETLEIVRTGLRETVASEQGTAHQTADLSDIAIAGKTGTAETGRRADHAWFAGYVPAEAPRYAFAVVLEHGGSGGEVAAPIARRLVLALRNAGYLAPRAGRSSLSADASRDR